jgi:hypothetical protein
MAIVGIEGFDYFETSSLPYSEVNEKENYTILSPSSGNAIISEDSPRFNTGKFLRVRQDEATLLVNVANTTITDTIYLGFATRPIGNIGATSFFYVWNSVYTACVKLFITDTGNIMVRTADGAIIATSTNSLNISTWYWIDIKVVMSSTSGSVVVKVDGDIWIDTTGITGYNSLSNITSFGLSAGTTIFDFDDVVWADSGGYPVTGNYIGDSRVETLLPTGDSSTEWSISSTGSNASHVNVVTDDVDDVDDKYVYTNITTDEDYYSYDTISSNSTVKALSIDYRAKRDDVGARTLQSVTSAGSQTGSSRTLYTGFIWYSDVFQFSDGISTEWDQTSIGSASFGIQDIT